MQDLICLPTGFGKVKVFLRIVLVNRCFWRIKWLWDHCGYRKFACFSTKKITGDLRRVVRLFQFPIELSFQKLYWKLVIWPSIVLGKTPSLHYVSKHRKWKEILTRNSSKLSFETFETPSEFISHVPCTIETKPKKSKTSKQKSQQMGH